MIDAKTYHDKPWLWALPPMLIDCLGDDTGRYDLSHPWIDGHHVYATNGRMVGRAAVTEKILEVIPPIALEKHPPAGELKWEWLGPPARELPYAPCIAEIIEQDETFNGEVVAVEEIYNGKAVILSRRPLCAINSAYWRLLWAHRARILIPPNVNEGKPIAFQCGAWGEYVEGLLAPVRLDDELISMVPDLSHLWDAPARKAESKGA